MKRVRKITLEDVYGGADDEEYHEERRKVFRRLSSYRVIISYQALQSVVVWLQV